MADFGDVGGEKWQESCGQKTMLRDKKTNTNIGIGLGLIIQFLRVILGQAGLITPQIGSGIWLVGVLFFIWGCMNYAEGKGAPKWYGWLGLMSLIGLLFLFFLPDLHKDEK